MSIIILSQRQKTPKGAIIVIETFSLIIIMAEARYGRILELSQLRFEACGSAWMHGLDNPEIIGVAQTI